MRPANLGVLLGSLMVLLGILIPSTTVIHFFRDTPENLHEQLALGASLFRASLAILGVLTMLLSRVSIGEPSRPGAEPSGRPAGRTGLLLLGTMLLVGLALRIYKLDSGLWLDEILTYVHYARMPFGEIVSTYTSENQHLLYSVLAHASFSIFGETSWALRLPAALFGVGSIWALFFFGRCVTNTREALLAAGLLTLSYHHAWFSQNARGYTGLLFWTLCASWAFLRGIHEGRRYLWVLYAVAAALGMYTNMTMVFVIMSHFLIYLGVLYTRRNEMWVGRWSGLLFGFCLVGALTFFLYALVLPQIVESIARTESVVGAWKQPLWAIMELARGFKVGFAGTLAAGAALTLFGAGMWSYARTNMMVPLLLILPAGICAVAVVVMGHHLWPRFFFFTIGFGALVVVRGTMQLSVVGTKLLRLQSVRAIPIGTALVSGLMVMSSLSLPSAYGPKQDYLGALNFVTERRQPGDAVVAVGLAAFPYKEFYGVDWETVETVGGLDAIRARARRTWVVYTIEPHLEAVYPDIMNTIRGDFISVQEFPGTLRGGTIFVYRSDAKEFTSEASVLSRSGARQL